MITGLSRHALIAVACSAAWPSLAIADTVPAEASPAGLSYISEVQLSPRLREMTFRTPALATRSTGLIPPNPTGETKVRVLLPEGYDSKGTQRYPVLYLFHGGGENQTVWTTPASKGKAEELTAGLPLIVVMPEGGIAGGYSDWYNNGAFGPPMWMTYHLDQLIPWIDSHFHTIADRSGRATAGLSMGGGGLRYAARRPDLIGATASFSGDIDLSQPASDWNGAGAPVSRMIWGDRKTQEVRWRGASAPDLAKNLGNTDVSIFSGDTGRPEGVYILPGSTVLHERLKTFGIPHRFVVYPGMTHSWPTWNRALAEWLPHLMARFRAFNPTNPVLAKSGAPTRQALAARPTAFSYSSVDPSYSLFGWSVQLQRKAVEFSALEVSGLHDFTLIGSGYAEVTTPRLGKPNARVRVTVANGERAKLNKTIALKADAQGRLSIPLELGPANPFQQYTAQANASATGARTADTPFYLFDNGSRFYHTGVHLELPAARLQK